MPQLDQVTFLSQFFWCSFFFIGFYFILAKHFLPKMSRILKLRTKKINPDTDLALAPSASQNSDATLPKVLFPHLGEGVSSLGQESQKISAMGDFLLANGLKASRDLFQEGAEYADKWSKTTKQGLNNKHYRDPNAMYVHFIGATSLSENFPPYAPSDAVIGLTTQKMANLNVENNSDSGVAPGEEKQYQAALLLKRFGEALATYLLDTKSSPSREAVKKQAKLAPSKKSSGKQRNLKLGSVISNSPHLNHELAEQPAVTKKKSGRKLKKAEQPNTTLAPANVATSKPAITDNSAGPAKQPKSKKAHKPALQELSSQAEQPASAKKKATQQSKSKKADKPALKELSSIAEQPASANPAGPAKQPKSKKADKPAKKKR